MKFINILPVLYYYRYPPRFKVKKNKENLNFPFKVIS